MLHAHYCALSRHSYLRGAASLKIAQCRLDRVIAEGRMLQQAEHLGRCAADGSASSPIRYP